MTPKTMSISVTPVLIHTASQKERTLIAKANILIIRFGFALIYSVIISQNCDLLWKVSEELSAHTDRICTAL